MSIGHNKVYSYKKDAIYLQWLFIQVSLEADVGNDPGYVGVRGLHVIPGYCHPVPLRATQGTSTHGPYLSLPLIFFFSGVFAFF